MNEIEFNKFLIREYLRLGSIEQVLKSHRYDLPISFASYHRLLNKFGIVKSAGPNSHLTESLHFLNQLATYKLPLERLYHQLAPLNLRISTNTLHRIVHYTRLGLMRRAGTALIITPKNDGNHVLVGNDQSLHNNDLGSPGDVSLPMTHSKFDENHTTSIKRVLQQEVFSELVVDGNLPNIIPDSIEPVFFINITDIKVSVYHLELPEKLTDFSSFKLKNLRLESLDDIQKQVLRPGVGDILSRFANPGTNQNLSLDSHLNKNLYALATQIPTAKMGA